MVSVFGNHLGWDWFFILIEFNINLLGYLYL